MLDGSSAVDEVPNVFHNSSGPETAWTTVNTAEALPGLLTPLGWTFWERGVELGFRGAFADLGVLKEREVVIDPSVDLRVGTSFYGHFVANVDTLRRYADRMPGTSGDALEEQLLGATRSGVTGESTRGRYPIIAAKMPIAAMRLNGRVAGYLETTDRWWRAAIAAPPTNEAAATTLLAEAAARFYPVMRAHILATFLCQAVYEQVGLLARAAGKPGLELRLTTGYGVLEESAVVRDIWEISRDRLSVEEFVATHGYHGPSEGEISSPSWREQPALLDQLIGLYRKSDDQDSPAAGASRQFADREAAERELRVAAGGGRARGLRHRAILRMARRHIPLREVGKAAFLRTVDVGRLAARYLGHDWHRRGLLDDPDDVFFLSLTELSGGLPAGAQDLVQERRAIHERYATLEIPQSWVGQPQPFEVRSRAESVETMVRGVAVSPGLVEGRAHVIRDPSELDGFEGGDVLVCNYTDPGWAPLLNLAGALVIDIGGPMSHGAIVARELGIPAVINTVTGTSVLRTGDRVLVDGGAGTVEVLER
jgi:pyruvate,water dikinase